MFEPLFPASNVIFVEKLPALNEAPELFAMNAPLAWTAPKEVTLNSELVPLAPASRFKSVEFADDEVLLTASWIPWPTRLALFQVEVRLRAGMLVVFVTAPWATLSGVAVELP